MRDDPPDSRRAPGSRPLPSRRALVSLRCHAPDGGAASSRSSGSSVTTGFLGITELLRMPTGGDIHRISPPAPAGARPELAGGGAVRHRAGHVAAPERRGDLLWPGGRHETGLSRRQNAPEPGFHDVPGPHLEGCRPETKGNPHDRWDVSRGPELHRVVQPRAWSCRGAGIPGHRDPPAQPGRDLEVPLLPWPGRPDPGIRGHGLRRQPVRRHHRALVLAARRRPARPGTAPRRTPT